MGAGKGGCFNGVSLKMPKCIIDVRGQRSERSNLLRMIESQQ